MDTGHIATEAMPITTCSMSSGHTSSRACRLTATCCFLISLVAHNAVNHKSEGFADAFSQSSSPVLQRRRAISCQSGSSRVPLQPNPLFMRRSSTALHVSSLSISAYSAASFDINGIDIHISTKAGKPKKKRSRQKTVMLADSSEEKKEKKMRERRRVPFFRDPASASVGSKTRSMKPRVRNSNSISEPAQLGGVTHSFNSGRLSREEEGELSTQLRVLKSAIRTRDELSMNMALESNPDAEGIETPQPTEAEWADECDFSVMELRQVMHDGREARSKLVACNAGLVTQIAKRHYWTLKRSNQDGRGVGTILTMQDLIQEGNLGLMEAAERFDPSKGFRFSTYATWWVRQRVLRSIADYSRVIRLPVHVHTMLKNISKARKEMTKQIGRDPSMPELAHHVGISIDKLQLYTDSSRSVLSLEVPIAGTDKVDQKRTLGDKIASKNPTPEEDAELDSLRTDIRAVVDELGDRERDVLVTRFGLDDGNPRSVDETAKRLGISRDRVRMVEARALNKLRHPQRNYRLKEYVGGSNAPIEPEPKTVNFSPVHGFGPETELTPESIWSF